MPTTLPARAPPIAATVEIDEFAAEVAIGLGMVSVAFFLLFALGARLTPDAAGIAQIFVG